MQIRAFQGQGGIAGALDEIRALIGDLDDVTTEGMMLGSTSHAALAAGNLRGARSEAIRRGQGTAINAVLSYSLAARAAIWLRDESALREDLQALREQGRGPAAAAHLVTFEAALAGFEGRTNDALAGYRRALEGWEDLGLPLYVAMTAIDMATTLGRDRPEVREALQAGRAILAALGARPFIERIDSLLEASTDPAAAVARATSEQGREWP